VIVCDEASMVSTRDLAALAILARRADAKLVLVGDPQQLGAVEAGGLFRLLAADSKAAELTGIHRFNYPWEAEATRRLRAQDPSVIDTYERHHRITSGSREAVIELPPLERTPTLRGRGVPSGGSPYATSTST
jgi:ATP-dependent exoDNAse (exonuclease V) alpha subunit